MNKATIHPEKMKQRQQIYDNKIFADYAMHSAFMCHHGGLRMSSQLTQRQTVASL